MLSFSKLFNLSFGKKKYPPLIGIDISSSSIKLVELDRDKHGKLILQSCAIIPIDHGWIVDGNIENFNEIANAIKRVIKKSGTKTRHVAMAIPPSSVITKKVVMSTNLTDSDLVFYVEEEANQYIPFPLNEICLDFFVIGPHENSTDEVDVMLAATRKEKVQDIEGLAEATGLKPVIIEIESYAAHSAVDRLISELPDKKENMIIALFEIGSYSTSMQIISNGAILYDRDQAFGGAQLTQLIVEHYGFSIEEAENKKRNDDLPDDYELHLLKPFKKILSQEIDRALQFFFSSTSYDHIDMIMLGGGSSNLKELPQDITLQTNIPCIVVNPFEGMEIKDNIQKSRLLKEAPSYLTACGLALRRY